MKVLKCWHKNTGVSLRKNRRFCGNLQSTIPHFLTQPMRIRHLYTTVSLRGGL